MKTLKSMVIAGVSIVAAGAVAHAQVGLGDTLKKSAGDAAMKGVNQQVDDLTGQGGTAVTPGAAGAAVTPGAAGAAVTPGAAKEQAGESTPGAKSVKESAEGAPDVKGTAKGKAGAAKGEAAGAAEGSTKPGTEKAAGAAEKGGKAAGDTGDAEE